MRRKVRSEAGIEKVALEAIKSGYRFLRLRDKYLLPAGASKLMSRRLRQLEQKLQRERRWGISEAMIYKFAREAADALSEILKALIRYIRSCFVGARINPQAS